MPEGQRYVAEAQGHVTVVVDRQRRDLIGAFSAGRSVSETIHEAGTHPTEGPGLDLGPASDDGE
jgi:pyruvate/2-oxoglutarate dehydrogenase complex dihydrolipoamide dehydrogenase (E3) component